MITTDAEYTRQNPGVTVYTYNINFLYNPSTPTVFTIKSYVTDAQRAFYGYTSTSKLSMVEFKLTRAYGEEATGTTLDAPIILSLVYDNTAYTPLSGNYCTSIFQRSLLSGLLTTTQLISNPCSEVYTVLNPATQATAQFHYTMANLNTGANITQNQGFIFILQQIEYVASY